MIKGKQCTVCFHVDDCKISHVNPKVIDDIITWLHQDYESIFNDGSEKMKVAQGEVHKYFGMTLDFTADKVVKVTMIEYLLDIIAAWTKACKEFDDGFELVKKHQIITMAAPDDLFKINEDAVKLKPAKAKIFHSIVAMMLYVTKWA